jgi:hypothetical protein
MRLADENLAMIFLIQALVGAIRPSLRRISLSFINSGYFIEYIFERDAQKDMVEVEEEVIEINTEFEAYFDGPIMLEHKIVYTDEKLTMPSLKSGTRVIFWRREE